MRTLSILALAALVAAGCSKSAPANEPGDVAERFLDLYLVEVDQNRALPFATGVARERLEDELAEVAGIRATGYTPSAAKPRIYYERVMLREDDESSRARAVYDLTIKQAGGEIRRHVLLSLTSRDDGHWKVASFTFVDGPSPRR